MRRGSSFRRGMAPGLRVRFAVNRMWEGIRSALAGAAARRGGALRRHEAIPRMTKREIKALTRQLIRTLGQEGQGGQSAREGRKERSE